MCRLNALGFALLVLFVALVPAANAQQMSGLEAGAAAADITGRVGTPMFAYTARSYLFSPVGSAAVTSVRVVDDCGNSA